MEGLRPDAIAQIKRAKGDHWFYFEIDKGTARIRQYELKTRRYAKFTLSGARRGEFPVFPENRTQIVGDPKLKNIVDRVLLDAGTQVVFGRMREQARAFAVEMAPVFEPEDFDRKSAFHFAVKTLVDNEPAPAFSAAVEPFPALDLKRFTLLREQRRPETGPPWDEVEALVQERYRRLGLRRLDKEPKPPASGAEEQQASPTFGNRYDFQSGKKDPEPDDHDGGPDA